MLSTKSTIKLYYKFPSYFRNSCSSFLSSSFSFPMASNNQTQSNKEEFLVPINDEFTPKPTPEITPNFYPTTPNLPPKYPSVEPQLLKRKPVQTTRFGGPSIHIDSKVLENITNSPQVLEKSASANSQYSTKSNTNKNNVPKKSSKAKKKLDPDEKEIYEKITSQLTARNQREMTIKFLVQFFVFIAILTLLVLSLTVNKFHGKIVLGVEIWRWFVLVMAIFSGILVTKWFVHLIVFFIEWKFMLKKNVVYFTNALQDNVVVFIWFAVVLGTWGVLIHPSVQKTGRSKKVINFITMTLATLLIGSFVWLIKTTLIKILASSFHLNRYFGRIQEAVYQHYLLQTLSGSPMVELAKKLSKQETFGADASCRQETGGSDGKGKETKVIDMSKLNKMKKEQVPAWTMKLLVDVVSNSGLSTMSGMLNEDVVDGGVELDDDEITSEEVAIATAVKIFYNVIGEKTERYIVKADFHRFMIWEEVDIVYGFFEVNDKGQIDIKSFIKWVVKVFKDRHALQHALNDNKTAVDEFNKILIAILIVLMTIVWLLMTEIASTKMLLFMSSQLIVAAFIFGNTCKTMFEAIIFVFVMHPFDVSDRVLVDGMMLVVEEMNILSTVFLKLDKEKLYYPNSVLATKPISNFYRSPDQGDSFKFSIDYRTPLPKIAQLKERIKQYLESNPNFWHPNHDLIVKEIENINFIRMNLIFNHTMNFQDFAERNKRRTELVLAMKDIFDSLEITFSLLPQEVVLGKVPTST